MAYLARINNPAAGKFIALSRLGETRQRPNPVRNGLSTRHRFEFEYFIDERYRNDVYLFSKLTKDVKTSENDVDSMTKFDLNNDIDEISLWSTSNRHRVDGSFLTGTCPSDVFIRALHA